MLSDLRHLSTNAKRHVLRQSTDAYIHKVAKMELSHVMLLMGFGGLRQVTSLKTTQVLEVVARIAPARVHEFEREFKEIMCFDPLASSYTPGKTMEWRRKKAAELGTTTYVTSGRQRQYEAAKAKAKA